MRAQTDGTDGLKVQTRRHISPTISQIPDLRNVDRQSFLFFLCTCIIFIETVLSLGLDLEVARGGKNYTGGITSPARDVKNDGSKNKSRRKGSLQELERGCQWSGGGGELAQLGAPEHKVFPLLTCE